jgi:hypothetical protein
VRTNYDQRDKTINVVFVTGPVGQTALVEKLKQRPAQGDVLELRYDPKKPSRATDAQASLWHPFDLVFVPLGPAMAVVAWARWNRWRRLRGRRADLERP